MAKGTYRSVSVKSVDVARLVQEAGEKVVIALDVAKRRLFAAFAGADGRVLLVVRWTHPTETREFFGVIERLVERKVAVEAVMEPTGTYGDPLRLGMSARGVTVFRIAGKRVKDAREVYDGVPSQHDAKATHLIARLHAEGLSVPWPMRTAAEKSMRVARKWLDHWCALYASQTNQIDGFLAAVWPELTEYLPADAVTVLQLLAAYGGPAGVAAAPGEARELMRRVGRSFLAEEKIEGVLRSAGETLGEPMEPAEVQYLRELASETLRVCAKRREAEEKVLALADEQVPEPAAAMVGTALTTALIAHNVAPSKYETTAAFLKALGLNLRETSSGKTSEDPGRHITKRGPGVPRQLLYLAALRAVKSDPWCRAWYEAKRQRDGGGKRAPKALVALMRKLARALFHVWRKGEAFDAAKLFDTARLEKRRAAA